MTVSLTTAGSLSLGRLWRCGGASRWGRSGPAMYPGFHRHSLWYFGPVARSPSLKRAL